MEVIAVAEKPQHKPVSGLHLQDIARFGQSLAGVKYPAHMWQLIAHAGEGPDATTESGLCA
ncbi:MAG: hypothetical protein QOC67_508, partial [Pseudonocardiales bacterium]|nr:hypothetical protein [Pseudonocardiales bacterium]